MNTTFRLELSFRDCLRACNLLERLGHNDNMLIKADWLFVMEDFLKENLVIELDHAGIEFDIVELS